ncbi:metalloregulator ArsR/SmtB family transcription factor [Acetobacter musti]|uniref:Metalloregulator ArsR/SmtB family transcription factor n=1 Tax=Acetobacter musti TaxID=864732 RepID=A0ABX0JRB6_9PROT|nr:metalloregulator ArsR/SmtB family transcription factor [Acetobacter musti]NHN85090.1 metalloregulator ArsR/SmtB family transcription factor [Acetobacter musti]
MTRLTAEDAKLLTERLRLLAQPQRLMILDLLQEGTLAVSDIEARTGIGQPTLSQQLGALRRAGIIAAKRDSRSMNYDFSNDMERRRTRILLDLLRGAAGEETVVAVTRKAPVRKAGGDGGGAQFARVSGPGRRAS